MRMLCAALLALLTCDAMAEVRLPKLISDGMVIQRRQNVRLWGEADSGESFKVVFRKKTFNVTADANGKWEMTLPPQKEGGPFTLTIGDKTVNDVMVGDVWLCSGQSNIDVMISRVGVLYQEEVSTARNEAVRLLKVDNATDVHGRHDEVRTSGWHVLEPKFANDFSALSYFLAKQLQERTGVPQGVIACSWGGTPIQSWIEADSSAWQPDRRQELMLAQQDDYVAALNRTGMLFNRWWSALMYSSDPGKKGSGWQANDTDESDWQSVNVEKDRWGRHGAGSWWLRQHINIDKRHAGKACLLRCGTIVDADSTFVNGVFVGSTGYQYPPRRYNIPEGLLREGDNIITVRITTGGQIPEFIFPKPYYFDYGNGDEVALSTQWLMKRGAILQPGKSYGISMQNMASACYNAMLYPLHNYTINSAIWYQGESNTNEPKAYERLLVSLMRNWRAIWQKPDMPFYIVQLPDYMDSGTEPEESGWVSLREAQRKATTKVDNATIVTGLGLGERHDIHPLQKKEMAARVMAEILGEGSPKLIGIADEPTPSAKSTTSRKSTMSTSSTTSKESPSLTLQFTAPLSEGPISGLELSADGRKFFNAQGVAEGNTVTVTCDKVSEPKVVRYAWHNSPDNANLKGKNGQPVCTFEIGLKAK